MSHNFDVIIIGAGPGGYVCAIKCAQLGLSVALVEERETLGGTCLNVGCIPSKALLQSSLKYTEAQHDLIKHGIKVSDLTLDFSAMQNRKAGIVSDLTKGIDFLIKKNKITRLKGLGTLIDSHTVQVAGENYNAKNIVIATGSKVAVPPFAAIDEKHILSSTGALALKEVPKTLAVIGAGVIGLEMASVYQRLGTKVTILEYAPRVLASMDEDLSKSAEKIFTKQGLSFLLSAKVTKVEAKDKSVELSFEHNSKIQNLSVDYVLVATGRNANTQGLGLDKVGIPTNKFGQIEVNKTYQTSIPHIYAIGDVITGPMLAHKAEEEGVAVAEILAGQHGHVNYGVIPSVVYTEPEIASVGQSEAEVKAQGLSYKIGTFPFMANGRAKALGHTEGFVKIIADAVNDKVLGVHIIGPEAGNLIQECCSVMEFGGASEDIARTCHAHPTLTEVVKEAALATFAKPIHG